MSIYTTLSGIAPMSDAERREYWKRHANTPPPAIELCEGFQRHSNEDIKRAWDDLAKRKAIRERIKKSL